MAGYPANFRMNGYPTLEISRISGNRIVSIPGIRPGIKNGRLSGPTLVYIIFVLPISVLFSVTKSLSLAFDHCDFVSFLPILYFSFTLSPCKFLRKLYPHFPPFKLLLALPPTDITLVLFIIAGKFLQGVSSFLQKF